MSSAAPANARRRTIIAGSDGVEGLAQTCAAAMRQGATFPTMWAQVLHDHHLVDGRPLQFYTEGRPQLEIPLVDGRRLIFDPMLRTFTVA